MGSKTFNRLLIFSLFFLAHWFFGNLYEEIVVAPNQLTNTYESLKHWRQYFIISNPIYYYVPFTQIAVIAVCYLYFVAKNDIEKKLLKKAGIFGLLAIAISIVIVTQLNLKLFFGDIEKYKSEVFSLSVTWLIANGIRLYFVGSSLYYTFRAYLLRQASIMEKTHRL
jgi:hypothetical protein